MTKFSERLLSAAKHAGAGETQTEIANNLGLTRQTVTHWFNKDGVPDGDNLALIEKRWGVNGEWLRSGDGEMLPQPSPDGLSTEERDLVKSYRLAPANVRPVIISMLRAARKAIVTFGVILPPFLASEAGSPTLHKQICGTDRGLNTDWMRMLRRLLDLARALTISQEFSYTTSYRWESL
jgi:transcriptional regulator with XRE-family HTH domain